MSNSETGDAQQGRLPPVYGPFSVINVTKLIIWHVRTACPTVKPGKLYPGVIHTREAIPGVIHTLRYIRGYNTLRYIRGYNTLRYTPWVTVL